MGVMQKEYKLIDFLFVLLVSKLVLLDRVNNFVSILMS